MNTILRTFAIVAVAAATPSALAVIPAGYYSTLKGKADAELKTAVYNIISNFTHPTDANGYNSTYYGLSSTFQQTDLYPNSNRWWDMYSDKVFYAPSFSGLNREHSFPKSWWGGDTNIPPYIDLNHLYPSERDANMAKSNFPLGEVDHNYTLKFFNDVSTVGYPVQGQGGGANYVFEPDDVYKGDFARTYFYMATAYQNLSWKYTYMVSSNTYPTLNSWAVELLLKWHRDDPVDDKEINRNDAVYRIQNNRNPFIDYPDLAEYIWGRHKGEAFDPGASGSTGGEPELFTPVHDMELAFADVAVGKSAVSELVFRGQDLTAYLYVTISKRSDNYEMFSLPVTTISKTAVNSTAGYRLPVKYTPTAEGEHNVRLIITGADIEAQYPTGMGVNLVGHAFPVPTLSRPVVEAPTDITSTSYVANWSVPQDETIDYWLVTRTRYVDGETIVETLESESSSLLIEGFDESDYECYSVKSSRLGYFSEESDIMWVRHGGVQGIGVDATQPFSAMAIDGGVRLMLSQPQSLCTIYDMTGRVVKTITNVTNNTEVSLTPGAYIIATDLCVTPVTVVVR